MKIEESGTEAALQFHRWLSKWHLKRVRKKKREKGAPGFEPGTSRSAVECSTTELYPLLESVF